VISLHLATVTNNDKICNIIKAGKEGQEDKRLKWIFEGLL